MKGSVRKRYNNAWSYRIDLGFVDGKRKQVEKGGFKTEREATKAMQDVLYHLNNTGDYVGNKILLSPSRPMPLRSAQNPHNCWVFETIYHSSCVLFDRPLHSKSCIKIVVVCRHIFL